MVNMFVITVERFQNRIIYYRKEVEPSGKIVACERFDCKSFVFIHGGKVKIFVGDRFDILRYAPYIYINDLRSGGRISTRKQMAIALQRYYTFCDLYDYDPKHFSAQGVERYIRFLYGCDVMGEDGEEIKGLCVETAKSEVSMVHSFLSKMKYDTEAFDDKSLVQSSITTSGGRHEPLTRERYSISRELRSDPLKRFNTPKHFTPNQAKKIVEMMVLLKDTEMLLIFRLGYGVGLRRGEILGITTEDIVEEYDDEAGCQTYKIIIRNRLTDNPDQRAKTLRVPHNEASYKSQDFIKSCQEVEISKSLYDDLKQLYEQTRKYNELGFNRYHALLKATKADSWNGKKANNYYLFFNFFRGEYYRLSGQTLNNRLKKYYDMIDLDLSNVSHAMRHSFAMFHAYYSKEKLGMEHLRVIMRHASAKSTEVYFNLTPAEKRELRERYSVEMAELIPQFK